MGDSNYVGFSNAKTTRALNTSILLLLGLSIFIFSVTYLRSNINNFLQRGDFQTSIIPNSSSFLTKCGQQVVNLPLLDPDQQRQSEEMDHSHCYLRLDLLSEVHLLDCATHIGQQHEKTRQTLGSEERLPSKVAFLFISRGEIPHEPLWRQFFLGHEEFYSLYSHTASDFVYPNTSLFYEHQIPSISVARMSISLVDAIRRLLAYSILDPKDGATNSWFVFLCESTVPIRSFTFTYNYLTESQHSFVDSFIPKTVYLESMATEPEFHQNQLRKGELWMALQLRHAIMVLEDWSIYYKFKSNCVHLFCVPDEQFIQTLLGLKDPHGIANRTVMYVNWFEGHTSSPFKFDVEDITDDWVQNIQGRVVDIDGQYHDTSLMASEKNITSRSCYYNGVPDSSCFLFVRKVASGATERLQNFSTTILGD